ncbi:MAG: hypothetical protein H7Z17_08985 [Fuerstia sp.]|nr:hypothetical protein [Fuerstiella sp.]
MVSAIESWLHQITNLTIHKYHTMSPQDYCIMLVLCVSAGYVLLRSNR